MRLFPEFLPPAHSPPTFLKVVLKAKPGTYKCSLSFLPVSLTNVNRVTWEAHLVHHQTFRVRDTAPGHVPEYGNSKGKLSHLFHFSHHWPLLGVPSPQTPATAKFNKYANQLLLLLRDHFLPPCQFLLGLPHGYF